MKVLRILSAKVKGNPRVFSNAIGFVMHYVEETGKRVEEAVKQLKNITVDQFVGYDALQDDPNVRKYMVFEDFRQFLEAANAAEVPGFIVGLNPGEEGTKKYHAEMRQLVRAARKSVEKLKADEALQEVEGEGRPSRQGRKRKGFD